MKSATLAAAMILISGTAAAQSAQTTLFTDSAGAQVLHSHSELSTTTRNDQSLLALPLWTDFDPGAIATGGAIGNNNTDAWVGYWLNNERVSLYEVEGSGTSVFDYWMNVARPTDVGVASAADTDLTAVLTSGGSDGVSLTAFDGSGNVLWSHPFAGYTDTDPHGVAINADGSLIAVMAYNGALSTLFLFDSAGSIIDSINIAGFATRIDMDTTGDRVVVTAGAVARVYDTATLTELHAMPVSGSGGYARISASGNAIAMGGFDVRAAVETAGVWQQAYSANGATEWFGAVSLSDDGQTLFAGSHVYTTYLTNRHRVVDLTTSSIVASSNFTGTGALQNSMLISHANADGTLFVVGSWGDAANTQPEVRVYDRELNLIDSLDTIGSPFVVELSPNEQYVLVCTKSAHANDLGSGGYTEIFELPGADCLADTNNDGEVTAADFSAWIAAFNASAPECDQNDDGLCTAADFSAWIANFNAGC